MSELTNLFDDFSSVTSEEWKSKIDEDIKGKSFEELMRQTGEGFDLEPFYTNERVKLLDIPTDRQFASWQIRQDFLADDFEITNGKILEALENGVDAIGLRIKESPNIEQLFMLLKYVPFEKISIHFFSDEKAGIVLEAFLKLTEEIKTDPFFLNGSFNFDPLCANETLDYSSLRDLVKMIGEGLPRFKALTIHGQPHNLETNTVQELSGIMHKVQLYWDALSSANYQLSTFANQVQFSVAIDTNYFYEIAKLRALRWLWLDWQKKAEIDKPVPAFVHAQKSWKLNAAADPYHNILQHTTEAMAAIIGGCDVLNLRSIDKTDLLHNDFFERISRNIQLILKHESHLDKVIDPARGSYYVEELTRKLVEEVSY